VPQAFQLVSDAYSVPATPLGVPKPGEDWREGPPGEPAGNSTEAVHAVQVEEARRDAAVADTAYRAGVAALQGGEAEQALALFAAAAAACPPECAAAEAKIRRQAAAATLALHVRSGT